MPRLHRLEFGTQLPEKASREEDYQYPPVPSSPEPIEKGRWRQGAAPRSSKGSAARVLRNTQAAVTQSTGRSADPVQAARPWTDFQAR